MSTKTDLLAIADESQENIARLRAMSQETALVDHVYLIARSTISLQLQVSDLCKVVAQQSARIAELERRP